MSMLLRRHMLIPKASGRGTADFWLENQAINDIQQDTGLALMETNSPYTVLFNWQITAGYVAETGAINFDGFSCNQSAGNFNTALRMGRFGTYVFCQINNQGINYTVTGDTVTVPMVMALRYNAEPTNNLTSFANGTKVTKTINYVQSQATAVLGGSNGSSREPPTERAAIVHGLYVYRRALTDNDIENWISNGIIP